MAQNYARRAKLESLLESWDDAAESAQQVLKLLPITNPSSPLLAEMHGIMADAVQNGASPKVGQLQQTIASAYARRSQSLTQRLRLLES